MQQVSQIEKIINFSNRRLQPSVLSSMSIKDILLGNSYQRHTENNNHTCGALKEIYHYLDNNEPTGREKTLSSKYAATRYVAILSMVLECEKAQSASVQEQCAAQISKWFESTSTEPHNDVSTSTNKVRSTSPERLQLKAVHRPSTNQRQRRSDNSSSSFRPTSAPATDLKYKTRDLRSAHVSRLAQIRQKSGIDSPNAEEQHLIDAINADKHNSLQNAMTQETPRQQNDSSYLPETSSEKKMDAVWRENRKKEASQVQKEVDVSNVMNTWSSEKSRDEGELLRRMESNRMIANTSRRQRNRRPTKTSLGESTTEEKLQQISSPPAATISSSSSPQPPPSKESPVVVVVKRKSGMRFRNQLPDNISRLGTSSSRESLLVPPALKKRPSTQKLTPSSSAKSIPSIDDIAGNTNDDLAERKAAEEFLPPTIKGATTTPRRALKKPASRYDAEISILQNAMASRRVYTAPTIPTNPRKGSSSSSSFDSATSERRVVATRPMTVASSRTTGYSQQRIDQMNEMKAIRTAFEKHKISFNSDAFEKALFVPEDKPTGECLTNLPTAGFGLEVNQFVKHKAHVIKKKKKKKIKKKKKKKAV